METQEERQATGAARGEAGGRGYPHDLEQLVLAMRQSPSLVVWCRRFVQARWTKVRLPDRTDPRSISVGTLLARWGIPEERLNDAFVPDETDALARERSHLSGPPARDFAPEGKQALAFSGSRCAQSRSVSQRGIRCLGALFPTPIASLGGSAIYVVLWIDILLRPCRTLHYPERPFWVVKDHS